MQKGIAAWTQYVPKPTDGPCLSRAALRSTREAMSAWGMAEPIPVPRVRHLQPHPDGQTGRGTKMAAERRPGLAQFTAVGSAWEASERSRGVDASSKSQSWGGNYSKTHMYPCPGNAASLKCILQCQLHNQELEVEKDFGWQENSHEGSCARTGGVWSRYWIWIQLICTYFL